MALLPGPVADGDVLQVFTTLPAAEDAERLARALVESGQAACVQVAGPINSTYRWQGRVEHTREWLCLVKTDRRHWPALEQAVLRLHPYDTPELIAVPVVAGNRRYLDWLASVMAGGGQEE
ncbi:MAG TPA: divalent-cation tolerance protein CutA [candidate division WOR-3 bacterium]|uniref:Divalent-cation tolerance protein CutA n=1 Tax=candidate division WOR-3 bacterium TaxID=2052148 RepID=A0A7V0T749_UNCW3|nr:divalent-cation tolerance protein CutA [candidate division WOR-3 bacterium]